MKTTLERLSAERDARIKCQQEHIAKLMKKLEKGHVHRLTKAQAAMRTKRRLIEVKLLRTMVDRKKEASSKMILL